MKERVNWTYVLCMMKNGLFMYMLANYICFGCGGGGIVFHAYNFFKINCFKKFFQKHYQNVNFKGVESRSGPTFYQS